MSVIVTADMCSGRGALRSNAFLSFSMAGSVSDQSKMPFAKVPTGTLTTLCLYDYVFFLARKTPVNLEHLRARLIQSGYLKENEDFSIADLKEHLNAHFEAINYNQAKEDAMPFIREQDSLNVWSADFFKQITDELASS